MTDEQRKTNETSGLQGAALTAKNHQELQPRRPAIRIEDLTMSYRETPVLWDVDLEIPQAVLCAVVGPNGAGKSTLIKGIMSLLKPLSGEISVLGMPFAQVRREVAYVPQVGEVSWDFPTTVLDVAAMGRYSQRGWIKRLTAEDREAAEHSLEIMGLTEMRHRQISELSGGQRQRVFLARALCQDARLFLLDEPLQGVDKTTEMLMVEQLKRLRDRGKTVIVVHHDLNTIKDYFDHIVMLRRVVVASGPVDQVFTRENIERTYGDLNLKGGENR